MEAKKRKKTGKIIFAVIVLLIIALLVALPFILDARQKEKTKSSVLSAEVKTGSIQKTFSGTGTITEQESLDVSVPEGVKVTNYLVKNGQSVLSGDPVATADRVSVMETISALKKAMDETAEEINSLGDDYYAYINAPAPGRIKAVYCKTGDAVEEIMLEHGALAILSLDGLMGVTIPDTAALSIGQSVSVILSDGTEVPGRVELAVDGEATITISDQYGSIDETVQIQLNNQAIGSGRLFVHSAWKAVASSGTVYTVFVAKDVNCWTNGTLISIRGSSDGSYERLLKEYQDYEELLEELFHLYQDGVLKAPADGIVSGVDEKLLKQLSYSTGAPTLELIANAPGTDSEKKYRNRLGMITSTEGNTYKALMQAWDTEIPDYLDTDYLITATESMTQTFEFSPVSVFQWDATNKEWIVKKSVEVGDVYIFAYDKDLVWMIYLTQNDYTAPPTSTPSSNNDGNDFPNGNNEGSNFAGIPSGDVSGFTGGGSMPTGDVSGYTGAGSGNIQSGGTGTGLYGGNSSKDEKRYAINHTTILSVTPQETVTVSITIDELDILDVHKGQEASVTLDALHSQVFTGVITEVNKNASNSGGHSKYSAVVELKRIPNMLGGMNASVSITTENLEGILVVPAEALDEQDGQTIVYTSYDSHTEKPGSPVTVKTGLSDGLSVQILSGLSEGDTVWYEYYEAEDETEPVSPGFLNRS